MVSENPEPEVSSDALVHDAIDAWGVGLVTFRPVRVDGAITEFRIVDANLSARRRWSEGRVAGADAKLSDYVSGEDRDSLHTLLAAALAEGQQVEVDRVFETPSGPVWRHIVAVPLGGDLVSCISQDNRALIDARQWASALSDYASGVVAISDPAGGVSWVSPSVEHELGYRPDQLTGGCVAELIHPDDVDEMVEAFGAVLYDRTQRRTVSRVLGADGAYRWFEFRIEHRRDDPVVAGMVFSLHNVDALVSTQRALEASEARHRMILDTAADAIITVDADGFVEGFNREAERLFGIPASEVIGERYIDMVPKELRDRVIATTPDWDALPDEPTELVSFRASGEPFHAQVTMSATEIDGRALITTILRDITSQRQTERELESLALYDDLTGLANRRLLIDRLDEAIRRASSSARIVGVMLLDIDRFQLVNDSMGHDIGDELLRLVAARLLRERSADQTVARLGGDEFVIVCEGFADVETLSDRAAHIAQMLGEPYTIASDEVFVTASIGISVWEGGAAGSLDLLRYAETAMYRARSTAEGGSSCSTVRCSSESSSDSTSNPRSGARSIGTRSMRTTSPSWRSPRDSRRTSRR